MISAILNTFVLLIEVASCLFLVYGALLVCFAVRIKVATDLRLEPDTGAISAWVSGTADRDAVREGVSSGPAVEQGRHNRPANADIGTQTGFRAGA